MSVFAAADTKISEITLRLGTWNPSRLELEKRKEARGRCQYIIILSLFLDGPCVRARWYQLDDASKQKTSRVSEARFRPRNREENTCAAPRRPSTPVRANAISQRENLIELHNARLRLPQNNIYLYYLSTIACIVGVGAALNFNNEFSDSLEHFDTH